MPRRKPDTVETVRFELGGWEREHLAPVFASQALDKYSEALGYLLDWQKLYLGITVIEVMTGVEILWGTPNDLQDVVGSLKDWWQANKDEYGGEGILGWLGLGRTPQTPEQIARRDATAQLYASAFGVTIDPSTTTAEPVEAPVYSSPADVWAQAFAAYGGRR